MAKSSIVRGLSFGSEFFTCFFKEVLEFSGTEEEVFDAIKTGSPLIKKWASEAIAHTREIPSLYNLMGAARVEQTVPTIAEENFPIQPEDLIKEKSYKKFYSMKTYEFEDMAKKMNKEGYRPATIREMLSWAVENWDEKYSELRIFAIGSHYADPILHACVPVLLAPMRGGSMPRRVPKLLLKNPKHFATMEDIFLGVAR